MSSEIRPLFVYGTLCAPPLLAWVLTGEASNSDAIRKLMKPARVYGYQRFAVNHADYPAIIKAEEPTSWVDGYLLKPETQSQRRKLDDFEGEVYEAIPVSVQLFDDHGELNQQTAKADMYLWVGDKRCLSSQPWDFDEFVKERLDDWLELFEGMEMVGDDL